MKILILTTRIPCQNGTADQITTFKLVQYLESKGIRVEVAVLQMTNVKSVGGVWQVLSSVLFKGLPGQVALYDSNENHNLIDDLVASESWDRIYIHLSRACIGIHKDYFRRAYVGLQISQWLNYSRTSSEIGLTPKGIVFRIEAALSKFFERKIVKRCFKANFVGKTEGDLFRNFGERVTVVPHGVDFSRSASEHAENLSRRKNIVFLANFASEPNRQALKYLLEKVWPTTRRSVSVEVELVIAGRNIPSIPSKLLTGVKVVGEVTDASEFISQHALFVNPVLASAGMQNKVVTALGAGTKVVATQTSVEGMDIVSPLLYTCGPDSVEIARAIKAALSYTSTADEVKRQIASIRNLWSWQALHDRWAKEFLDYDFQRRDG